MTTRAVITVDGLAASGKTTLSRLLAQRLGFVHFNSGLLYRAIGLLALRTNVAFDDEARVLELLSHHTITCRGRDSEVEVLVDGVPAGEELFTAQVSEATSSVSVHPRLRAELIPLQRQLLPDRSLVAEGRDMGTVIFPEAPLKFFVVADEEVRAERRLAQREQTGGADLNQLKRELEIEIRARDLRDAGRAVAPTLAAPDAVEIDNGARTLTEVLETMYDLALARGLVPKPKG